MNWNAIAAVSELVAAVAVVVSLIYIAVQVSAGAKAFQTSLRDQSYRTLMEWNWAITSDETLPWIFQQGARDFESLGDRDRARAMHAFYSFFKMFENMYLHYLEGVVSEQAWVSNREVLFAYASQPGCQYYLSQRMPVFDPRFQVYLQNLEAAAIPTGSMVLKLDSESAE